MLQADKLIKEAFLTANWFIEDRPSLNGCSFTDLPTSIYLWDGVVTGYFSWRSRYFMGCSGLGGRLVENWTGFLPMASWQFFLYVTKLT